MVKLVVEPRGSIRSPDFEEKLRLQISDRLSTRSNHVPRISKVLWTKKRFGARKRRIWKSFPYKPNHLVRAFCPISLIDSRNPLLPQPNPPKTDDFRFLCTQFRAHTRKTLSSCVWRLINKGAKLIQEPLLLNSDNSRNLAQSKLKRRCVWTTSTPINPTKHRISWVKQRNRIPPLTPREKRRRLIRPFWVPMDRFRASVCVHVSVCVDHDPSTGHTHQTPIGS